MEEGEKAVITVYVVDWDATNDIYTLGEGADAATFIQSAGNLVQTNGTFTLEVKPPSGAVLTVERTTPAYLDTVMELR